ncbi:MAG: ATP-binding protein [Bdellovibrionales bacterium]|nr:ATP-binding protein [Bdellovibrionales bacterium]
MEIYKVALQGNGFVDWLNFNQPMTFNEDLVLTQVYETLFNKNELGQLENNLVDSYELKKNELIIYLCHRKFHDGKVLTALDVINSLKQSLNSPFKHNNNGWTVDFVQLNSSELTAINAQTFSINIQGYQLPEVLEELCKVRYSIKRAAIGTGPYFVDQIHSKDQKVILKQNPHHPSHQQCVDEVHLIGYKNNFETLRAFLNKEVDQVRVWGLKSPFKYNPNTLMVPSKTFYSSYFQFNTKSQNFDSSKKRLKFRTTFLTNIMLHKDYPWNAFTGVTPCESFQAPKQGLKNKDTKVVTLGVAHKRQKKEVERIINKEHFKSLGYKIKIINFESYESLYNSNVDLIYTAFSYEQNNKHKIPEIFHSKHRKNRTKYNHQKLDQLIEQKNYKEAEDFIWNKALIIPLGWFQCHILTHKDSNLFCGIKNNKVTPVLYKSKLQDFIELFSVSQKELFKLREKNWSQLSQKAKLKEVLSQFQHDIKSPLSALRLMSQNLPNTEKVYDRVLKRVEEFNFNIEKEIISAIEKEQGLQNKIDINNTVHEIVEEKKAKIISLSNVNFDLSFSKDLSPINGSSDKFKRVLSNLIDNAIESRDKWKHTIKITTLNKGPMLIISIKDNGKGFQDKDLESVKNAQKITSKKDGHGLGLYNAKKYIESLDGEFQISSKPHQYTEVLLKLQLDRVVMGNQSVNGVQKLGT